MFVDIHTYTCIYTYTNIYLANGTHSPVNNDVWAERFAPLVSSDLAVHKDKVFYIGYSYIVYYIYIFFVDMSRYIAQTCLHTYTLRMYTCIFAAFTFVNVRVFVP